VTPAEINALVARTRRRLEAVRVLKAAARGALAGGAAGLVALLAMKGMPALAVVPALPWALVAAGGLAGIAAAAWQRRIQPAAVALFLDARLGTRQRIATVATRPVDPFIERAAAEVSCEHRPRLPFPREAALVPAALFLVFAASLLPEAGAAPGKVRVVVAGAGTDGAASAEAPAAVDPADLDKLARGEPPAPAEAEKLREAVESRVNRPEERARAEAALDKALQGDRDAAAELARALAREREGAAGLLQAGAYPEEVDFLREYRRARAEEE
jgi:hypothetical protein